MASAAPTVAAATSSAASASAPVAPAPVELAPGGPTACRFDATAHLKKRLDAKYAVRPYELAFGVGQAAFASILGAPKGELEISVGEASLVGTFLRVELEEVELFGIVEPRAVRLHAQKPFALRGIFVPDADAELTPTGGETSQVRVRHPNPGAAYLAMREGSLDASRPCEDLGLEPATFELQPLVPKATLAKKYLIAKAPISATVRDAPVADLSPIEGDDEVRVVGRDGKLTRIVAARRGGYVVGWVPDTALALKPRGIGVGSNGSIPGPPSRFARSRTVSQASCDHDLPLIARQGDQARIVGKLRAGAAIRKTAASPSGEQGLELGGDFGPGDDTTFSVRASDLKGCAGAGR
jgi:hypothetical protein